MALPTIVLFIRGHIRDSFKNAQLVEFVKMLSTRYVVQLYIHTWSVYSTKLSWRNVSENTNRVTFTDIMTYFSGLNIDIKSVDIDDDQHIELVGDTNGNIFSTLLPKLAWKRMWYGIHKTLKKIVAQEELDVLVVNTRFDVFNNSFSQNNEDVLIELIDNNLGKPMVCNQFLNDSDNLLGVDNYYVGSPNVMYDLANNFHTNLDAINERYGEINFQEVSVFYENVRLFSKGLSDEEIYKNIGNYILKADAVGDSNVGANESINDRIELLRNNLKLQNDAILNADFISIGRRGLMFVNGVRKRAHQQQTNYKLSGVAPKPPPAMKVQHTVSNWKGFGKK